MAALLLLGTAACGTDAPAGAAPAAITGSTATATPPAAAEASDGADPAATPTIEAPAPTAEPAPTTEAPAAPAFDGTVVDVEIAGGEVRTAEPRVVVPLGGQVRLVVTTDAVDEVHVHGVDEYVPLAPGAPVTHDFTASIPGIFEVELHDAGDLLFTLQVQP